jgi:hypothetical protein
MSIRRVVTSHDAAGRSILAEDAPVRRSHDYKHPKGFSTALVWSTQKVPAVPNEGMDPTQTVTSLHPEPGGTRFMIVTFPPDSVMMSESFDPVAAGQESMANIPGLAERFEIDNPGMHRTDSVDYGIILDGEIWLELDDGKQVHLKQHDTVIQNGTRHAWRNKTEKPTTLAFVLIGAQRLAKT